MCHTCNYTNHMSGTKTETKTTMIQLRHVPGALHRHLKSRAALAGLSLLDYLLAEIKEIAERPTLAELRAHLRTRKPVNLSLDTARLVREERDKR